MKWRIRTPAVPLVEGDTVNVHQLSPRVAAMLKVCLGKLDLEALNISERDEVHALYKVLPDAKYTLLSKGQFDNYGAPVEKLKAVPPNPKRK